MLRRGAIRREARGQVARLDARIARLGQKLGTLSGGNQQKIILGRSLVTHPRVLILHEPTRGIDVGAKAEIYAILRGIAGEGVAIVMISSEIPELIMNAERVLVLRGGRISGELSRAEHQRGGDPRREPWRREARDDGRVRKSPSSAASRSA